MNAQDHREYQPELQRLEYTKEYVEKTIAATEAYRRSSQAVIREALTEMDDQDSSQNYIDVLINSQMVDMAERNYDGLVRARKKPYFARIDFREEGKKAVDCLYIGKTSLYRAEDEIPLIVDWRAPVASVYYEGRIGESAYEAEGVRQQGELLLKRQYTIDDGLLKTILDVDITTNDAFLQAALEGSAEDKLKDIAATIQAEQNRVIRADMARPLIVQGAAGSGKTTIALHRIAYFIYTYEKLFDPESFMIIAPNRLFINYISEVLPELGVEKVVQTTFIDLAAELIGTKYRLTDPAAKLVDLIHAEDSAEARQALDLMKWSAAFKGSIAFKGIVDAYILEIIRNFIPPEDFAFEGHVIVPRERVAQMINESASYLPLNKTLNEVKKSLKNQLKLFTAELSENTRKRYDRKIHKLWISEAPTEERRLEIVGLIDSRDQRLEVIHRETGTLVRKYLARFPKVELYSCYRTLVASEERIHRYAKESLPPVEVAHLCRISEELLHRKHVELEDVAPLVYLKHRLVGFDREQDIRSVVIDEAQDFSLFQLAALKTVFNTEMFTLLGDLSQGIHSYRGIRNWEDVQAHVFTSKPASYMTLVQSYRTTIEVMTLANQIIGRLGNPLIVPAEPVIRHGAAPDIRAYHEESELLADLETKIRQLQREDFKSIAVICKTNDECALVQNYLAGVVGIQAALLSDVEDHYGAGVVIVPSYLAKGLEFDGVLIVCIRERYREEELDIMLLYVAMTRALHRLSLLHMAECMPILREVSFAMPQEMV